ncbi:MAG: S1 RNA-binding domain-containing protein [Lachnospiraceae bacterium]|nr:S1 RNA-binding domain-containing protein [Lachnospiraceae bacterium]
MIKLGKTQRLSVVKTTDFGVYLSDEGKQPKSYEVTKGDITADKILLPKNQVPAHTKVGDKFDVFVYKDSEDRPIATTTVPKLELGEVALLTVKETSSIGAFLDWGLVKDLMLPFKEQTYKVQTGDQVLVALYIDKSRRLCATMKVYNYLATDGEYEKEQKVTGLVYEVIDAFGAFVAVDNKYSALIPNKELFRVVKPGEVIEGRITMIHEDGKMDLSIREKGHIQMDADAELIFNRLEEAGGFLPYHDKSDPEMIKLNFNLSKNAFKRAIGRLMKEGRITISDTGITKK